MKDLAIYCAGGFGREIYCLIFNRIKNLEWRFVGFFDDGVDKGKQLQYGVCLGGMKELNEWNTPLDLVIANGSPKWLQHISESVTNSLVNFPNVIDPSVVYLDKDTFKIGKGNILNRGTSLSVNVEIGNFNVFNADVKFGHEAKIGNFNAFMPNVRISGEVEIGNSNLLGACTFVIQGVKIGTGVHLSPGSILLRNPKDNSIYIGNPAKNFKFD
ncbi:serine acetyltransferase [Butyricimonas virosa]|uniref:PglD-related sugar-binding protein n=1 Tax=Butyricimonas virosa TaxID=544645 RepID=UPI0032C193A9